MEKFKYKSKYKVCLPNKLLIRLEKFYQIRLSKVRFYICDQFDCDNILAYTQNNCIYFLHNWYQPATFEGTFLIAHEVCHIVQQMFGLKNITEKQIKKFDEQADEQAALFMIEILNKNIKKNPYPYGGLYNFPQNNSCNSSPAMAWSVGGAGTRINQNKLIGLTEQKGFYYDETGVHEDLTRRALKRTIEALQKEGKNQEASLLLDEKNQKNCINGARFNDTCFFYNPTFTGIYLIDEKLIPLLTNNNKSQKKKSKNKDFPELNSPLSPSMDNAEALNIDVKKKLNEAFDSLNKLKKYEPVISKEMDDLLEMSRTELTENTLKAIEIYNNLKNKINELPKKTQAWIDEMIQELKITASEKIDLCLSMSQSVITEIQSYSCEETLTSYTPLIQEQVSVISAEIDHLFTESEILVEDGKSKVLEIVDNVKMWPEYFTGSVPAHTANLLEKYEEIKAKGLQIVQEGKNQVIQTTENLLKNASSLEQKAEEYATISWNKLHDWVLSEPVNFSELETEFLDLLNTKYQSAGTSLKEFGTTVKAAGETMMQKMMELETKVVNEIHTLIDLLNSNNKLEKTGKDFFNRLLNLDTSVIQEAFSLEFIYHSHLGEMQFLHSMDTSNGNLELNKKKIIRWAKFCCEVYQNKDFYEKPLQEWNITEYLLKLYYQNDILADMVLPVTVNLFKYLDCIQQWKLSNHGSTINQEANSRAKTAYLIQTMFNGTYEQYKKILSYYGTITIKTFFSDNFRDLLNPGFIALGCVSHMIEDSFTNSHARRAYNLYMDIKDNPIGNNAAEKITEKIPPIFMFTDYTRQNSKRHARADVLLNKMNIDTSSVKKEDQKEIEAKRLEYNMTMSKGALMASDCAAQFLYMVIANKSWTEINNYLELVFSVIHYTEMSLPQNLNSTERENTISHFPEKIFTFHSNEIPALGGRMYEEPPDLEFSKKNKKPETCSEYHQAGNRLL